MQTKTSANFYWVDIFGLITNFYNGMEEKHAETSQSYYLGHPFYLLCVCARSVHLTDITLIHV